MGQRAEQDQVADFSMAPSDLLAQMVVDAWVDQDFQKAVGSGERRSRVARNEASFGTGRRGRPWSSRKRIMRNGYSHNHHGELVFVLPDHDGTCPPGKSLLRTARLLMAATPNGI